MKKLPVGLALLLPCLLFTLNSFAQSSPEIAEVAVEEITLSRDDGEGHSGEETAEFSPTDVPIHCSILLSSTDAVEVWMNLVAVKAPGYKAGEKIVVVSYKTNGRQHRVNFTAQPPNTWPVGTYRVDIYLGGMPGGSVEFEVTKDSGH